MVLLLAIRRSLGLGTELSQPIPRSLVVGNCSAAFPTSERSFLILLSAVKIYSSSWSAMFISFHSRALTKPGERGETDGLIGLSDASYPRVWTRKDARGTTQAAGLRVGGAVWVIIVAVSQAMMDRIITGGNDMVKKNLTDYMQERLVGARRNLSLAAIDFSIPDEKILELRRVSPSRSRRRSTPQKEKGLSGFLGVLIVAATSAAGRRYLPRMQAARPSDNRRSSRCVAGAWVWCTNTNPR